MNIPGPVTTSSFITLYTLNLEIDGVRHVAFNIHFYNSHWYIEVAKQYVRKLEIKTFILCDNHKI